MTDKDPKDMTASELMRYLHDRNSSCSCFMCNKVLNIVGCGEHVCADAYEALADKIDAELAEARKDAIRESKKPMWWFRNAIKCGYDWPEPRDGEKFRDYLHRCFLPRPRFEDGEPVQFEDNIDELHGVEKFIFTLSRGGSCQMQDADGMPIVEGETVWLDEAHSRCAGSYGFEDGNKYSLCGIERQEMLTVEDAHIEVDGREYVRVCTCGAWCHASWLTHTPPDTQQRIDEDKGKKGTEYWRCVGFLCGDCPAEIDGKRPSDRYGVLNCSIAQGMDIARRQADLDARKGGE